MWFSNSSLTTSHPCHVTRAVIELLLCLLVDAQRLGWKLGSEAVRTAPEPQPTLWQATNVQLGFHHRSLCWHGESPLWLSYCSSFHRDPRDIKNMKNVHITEFSQVDPKTWISAWPLRTFTVPPLSFTKWLSVYHLVSFLLMLQQIFWINVKTLSVPHRQEKKQKFLIDFLCLCMS